MEDRVVIPRTLDAPYLFLFVEADTATVFLVLFFLGALFNIVVAIPLSWLIVRVYVRHKNVGARGLLLHQAYWWTPSTLWLSRLARSSRREYAGR